MGKRQGHQRLGRRPTFPKSNLKIDRASEPVKNVLFPSHNLQREINNIEKLFQAFSYLPESVDFDGKT
jgi:hypothetical protein